MKRKIVRKYVAGLDFLATKKIKLIRKSTEEEISRGYGEYTYESTEKEEDALRFHKKDLDKILEICDLKTIWFQVTYEKGKVFNLAKLIN